MWFHRLHFKIVWNKLFIKAWGQKISIPIQVLAVCLGTELLKRDGVLEEVETKT